MKIELYKFPDTIDDGMQHSDHWQMMEMLNRIADGINVLLEDRPICSCPVPDQEGQIREDLIKKGAMGASGMCNKHGRWEIINPKLKEEP